MKGIRLAGMAYLCFTVQDALVKWLVATYPVCEVLFVRSLVALLVALACVKGEALRGLRAGPRTAGLLLRAVLNLAAWLLFYGAARSMGLAEVTTFYFVAPTLVVGLSIVVLGEKVGRGRWAAVACGFAGVLVAAKPSGAVAPVPALMAVAAAACWATSSILVRLLSRAESTAVQMLASNAFFAAGCGLALVRLWVTPDPGSLALMCGVGLAGALAQFFLFESFRHAPASLLASTEYTGFVWAFLLGYLVWGDVPSAQIWVGAGLILASRIALVWSEARATPA